MSIVASHIIGCPVAIRHDSTRACIGRIVAQDSSGTVTLLDATGLLHLGHIGDLRILSESEVPPRAVRKVITRDPCPFCEGIGSVIRYEGARDVPINDVRWGCTRCSADTSYGTLTCTTIDERTDEDKTAEELRLKQRSQPLADVLAAAATGKPQ